MELCQRLLLNEIDRCNLGQAGKKREKLHQAKKVIYVLLSFLDIKWKNDDYPDEGRPIRNNQPVSTMENERIVEKSRDPEAYYRK
ncbi:hypothetical protein G9A89_015275 [Geosiphon pyriformis]|nr:hypothetical protein G9A89_015275 [Geosiphon pyriformis]